MAESESQPHLASPGEGDVERLLREAEALTQEVAHATGTPDRDADALLSGEIASVPDPLTAVEAASTSIMSLEDLLSEMGPGAGNIEQTSHLSSRASETPRVEIETRPPQPRVEHMPTEEDSSSAPHQHSDAGEPKSDPEAGKEPAKAAREPRPPRKPLGPRILSGSKAAARGAVTFVLMIVRDLPVGVLSWFDLPFRRTPRGIKNAIGIIGAITLCMGALAWALPDLMRPKPATPAGESHADAPASHDSGHAGGH